MLPLILSMRKIYGICVRVILEPRKTAALLRKHGCKTGEELKAEGN
jgi:hypothetical protein